MSGHELMNNRIGINGHHVIAMLMRSDHVEVD